MRALWHERNRALASLAAALGHVSTVFPGKNSPVRGLQSGAPQVRTRLIGNEHRTRVKKVARRQGTRL